MKMIFTAVLFLMSSAAFASSTPLQDVDIKANWAMMDSRGLPQGHNMMLTLSACATSKINDPALVAQHTNLSTCRELGRMSEYPSSSRNVEISALALYSAVKNMGADISETVLMLGLWNSVNGQDVYVAHQFINPMDLAGADKTNVVTINGSQGSSVVSVSFKPSDIDAEFRDLNPPVAFFQPENVAALTGHKAENLKLADYLLASIFFYVDPKSPIWDDVSKGFPLEQGDLSKSPDITKAQKYLATGDMNRALKMYSIQYHRTLDQAQGRLQARQDRLNREAAARAAEQARIAALQAQAERDRQQQELQRRQTEAMEEQARYARQQRQIQNAQAGVEIGAALGSATADAINNILH